jgi:hypothetical protein
MKSGSWRFLLICLMLVLLPLQGFAATGMWAFVHGNIRKRRQVQRQTIL